MVEFLGLLRAASWRGSRSAICSSFAEQPNRNGLQPRSFISQDGRTASSDGAGASPVNACGSGSTSAVVQTKAGTFAALAGLEPDCGWDCWSYSDWLTLGDATLLHSKTRVHVLMRREHIQSITARRNWTPIGDGTRVQIEAQPVNPFLVRSKDLSSRNRP